MVQRVQLPNGQVAEFPDDMSQQDIEAAIRNQPELTGQEAAPQPSSAPAPSAEGGQMRIPGSGQPVGPEPASSEDSLQKLQQAEGGGGAGGGSDSPSIRFMNRGIAQALGFPVDIVNMGLGLAGQVPGIPNAAMERPIGGSRFIEEELFHPAVLPKPGERPDEFADYLFRELGASAMFGLGGTSGVRALTATRRGATAKALQEASRKTIQRPGAAGATDIAASTGAAAGAAQAQKLSEEYDLSPEATQAIGELAGGIAVVAGGPAAMKATGKAASKTFVGTVAGGVQRRIAERKAMQKGQQADELDAGTEDAKEFVTRRRDEALQRAEVSARQAVKRVEDRLNALGPRADRATANRIVREELDGALARAREAEDAAWAAVPEDVQVRLDSTREIYRQMLERQPKTAAEDNIPGFVESALGRLRKPGEGGGEGPQLLGPSGQPLSQATGGGQARLSGGALGTQERVDELQNLRSEVLREIRAERAKDAPNRRKIGNLDRLQEAILEDLGAAQGRVSGEAGQRLRTALDYSKSLNERFTQGSVGKLLGFERRGGERVPPEMTLESSVGRGGPQGGVEVDALLQAVDDAPQETRRQIENFLTEGFRSQAVTEEGLVTPSGARQFVRKHGEILKRFPELDKRIRELATTQKEADRLARRSERLSRVMSNANLSRMALFADAPIDEEMRKVLRSQDPGQTMKLLVNSVKKDPTGRALQGLKTGFVEHLMGRASTNQGKLSGQQLDTLISDSRNQRAIRELFTPAEQRRIKRITEVLRATQEGKSVESLGGVTGAYLGRQLNSGTIQVPGIFSERGKQVFRKVLGGGDEAADQRIKELFADAVQDESLFRTLFTPLSDKARRGIVLDRLQGWVGGPATAATGAAAQPDEEGEPVQIPGSGVRVE